MRYHRHHMYIAILFHLLLLGLFFSPVMAYAGYQPPMPTAPGEPENGKIDYYTPEWCSDFGFVDNNGEKQKFSIRGERWQYNTTFGEDKAVQEEAILAWLNQAGCTILARGPDKIIAQVQKDAQNNNPDKLTYYFEISNNRTRVWVYLERTLTPENAFTLSIGGDGRDGFDVWLDHDGKHYTSLVVQFEKERVVLNSTFRSNTEGYGRSMYHNHACRIEHGPQQIVFDIPQYEGAYKWRVYTHCKTPQAVSIHMEQGPPIPEFSDGPGLGALRVRNLPNTAVSVKEEWHASSRVSRRWTTNPDRTPEGDVIFWLAPGYWQVYGAPPKDSGLTSAVAHMIPVHAGKTTRVDWPRSFSTLFAPKGIGRLEILDAKHQENTAHVDISLVELDDNILPEADRMNCYEGGVAGTILSVEPLKTPLNVVLLLDSSGSMKGSMKQALDAVKTFVTLFPENAKITVVDFDTKPKTLPADNQAALLKAIDGVKANGATALYDSILLGMDKLEKTDRKALVVFTDGVDANWNDTGPGSKATKPDVMKAVESGRTPVFTIGFGKKPDVDTLTRVASLSGGAYYEAHDKKTLDTVFAKISDNLGRQYRVTYQRPQMAALSDIPVMALVVDNSGSMDMDPKTPTCDFRIEKVKQILKDFRNSLPENFLVQLITFEDEVHLGQVITSDPAPVIRGLSLMKGYGGTNILGSTTAALETLKAVPSSRKYLVYLTDAAMKVEEKFQRQLDTTLASLKDEGIQSLFVGVVDADKDGAFEHAAKMSGGKYVISTDLAKVKDVFDELAGTLNTADEKEKRLSLQMTLSHRDDRGKNRLFSDGQFVDFPMLPLSDRIISPETLAWSIEGPMVVCDTTAANTVLGSDRLDRNTIIDKRIPLEVAAKGGIVDPDGKESEADTPMAEDAAFDVVVKGSNQAMEIKAMEMIFLSRLRDIDPPGRHRFLVIPMTLTNILKSQKVAIYKDGSQHPAAWMAGGAAPLRYEEKIPPYLIPDLTQHMFLTWNNGIRLPVSPVTWLCEEPLLVPGERALSVLSDQPVTGACAFIVPNTEMTQASLHFYDVNYGHMDIPLVGIMPEVPVPAAELPTKAPKKLGDSFALTLSNVTDHGEIGQISAGEGFVFRIIEGYLTSQIQALLSINPRERFTYHLPTKTGDFVFKLHEATEIVPMGFYGPAMMTPGSKNLVRMAYRMPRELAARTEKGYLFVDVFGGGVHIDLADAPAPASNLKQAGAAGQGMEIFINQTGLVKERVADRRGNLLAVDITFKDASDRSHTQLGHLVVLKKKGTGAANWGEHYQRHHTALHKVATEPHKGLKSFGRVGVAGEELVKVTGACMAIPFEEKYIFGMDEKSVIFDGQTRRGVMLFELPRDEKAEDWELSSWILPDVSLPISNEPFNYPVLFSERLILKDELGEGFWRNLEKKVAELKAIRTAKGYERPGSISAKAVDLDTADLGKQPMPVPGVSSPGAQKLKQITRIKDIWKTLANLQWRPGRSRGWRPNYAPEVILTQGWGDPSDLAALAEQMLNRQGVMTKRILVIPTEAGKKALADMIHTEHVRIESLPALLYTKADKTETLMVFPWCKPIDDLEGLVTWNGEKNEPQDWPQKVRLQVKVEIEPIPSGQSTGNTRVAASALAGGDSVANKRWETLYDYSLLNQDVSLDAIDIGYTETRKDGRPVLQVIVDGPNGRQLGQRLVELDKYTVVNEWVGASLEGCPWTSAQQPVDADHPITGRFHVFSLNAPDLTPEIVKELEAVRKKKYSKEDTPDGLSALKWYGRSIIDRFVAAQTRFEQELAEELNLTVGRSLNGRSILVTVQRADKNADPSTRMDLLHVVNDIHGGKAADMTKASRAFNILSGIAAAQFEAAAIPVGGTGVFELWAKCPKDTHLAYIDHTNKRAFMDMLKEKGFSDLFVKTINDCNQAILFPSHPAIIDGKPRWGWLEIDPKTYTVVSRLDNGAAGAMTEHIIGNLFEQATSYLVGALVGIDVCLWSVSAFSLQMEDYEQICKSAKAFALNSIKFGAERGKTSFLDGFIELQGGLPPVTDQPSGSPSVAEVSFERAIKFSLEFDGFKCSTNLLGFENGYKDAVNYYFSD